MLDSYRSVLDVAPAGHEESLFCRTLSVQLTDERGSRTLSGVCVSVKKGSSGGRKQLRIQLTDETDPFFVYSLALTEEDFESLKCQQGLLVDFAAFPHKLADLLQLCLDHEHRDSPKFVVRLSVAAGRGEAALVEVVEANPFKHLVHLSLTLRPPNEGALRKHLATVMRTLKDEKRRLEASLCTCEEDWRARLERSEALAAEKSKEAEQQRAALTAQLASLGEQHLRELRTIRDEMSKASSEQRVRMELERHETEQRQRKQLQTLEAQGSLLEALNKDLQEKLCRSEQCCRDLGLKVSALEAAVGEQSAQALCREKEGAEKRDVVTLRSRVAELECELASARDQLDAATGARREAVQQREECLSKLERREAAVRTLSGDIVKANQIIRRLQGELHAFHSQLRERSEALADRERQLEELSRTADQLRTQHANGHVELERVQRELSEAQTQLDKCQRQVKTHENVIQWLNQQLNQRPGANQGTPGFSDSPSAVPVLWSTSLPRTPGNAVLQPAKGLSGATPQVGLRTPLNRGPQAAKPS